jgi:antitoxin component of RelBE/YafQ-DinJ toxin-antitoxin module
MLYAQIELLQAMPFELSIPNQKTREAMRAVREGQVHQVKDADALFRELDR